MRTLRLIHRWLGLFLALPLILEGLTGAILTVEPVIPNWGSAVRSEAPASPNRLLEAARAASPADMRLTRYVPPTDERGPALVHLARADAPRGAGMVLRLDPATATPLGPPEPEAGVLDWIRRLHTNVLLPQWGGRQLVGWLGAGLLLVSVLGLPLWWPRGRWQDGFSVPRGARGLLLHRRLHGAAGIWLWVMLIATSTTGIVQGFPQTARAALGLPAGGPPRLGRPAPGTTVPRPDLDGALRLAAQAAPGTVLRMAILPSGPSDPIRVFLGRPGTEGVSTSITLTVDAEASRVLSLATPASASAGETALRWAHDLHFGQGFGPVWRALTVATGPALLLFAVTGTAIWLGRRRNRRRVSALRQAALEAAE